MTGTGFPFSPIRPFWGRAVDRLASWYGGSSEDWNAGIELSCARSTHAGEWWKLRYSLFDYLLGKNGMKEFDDFLGEACKTDHKGDGADYNAHPLAYWTYLPEYDDCPLGALALRLYRLSLMNHEVGVLKYLIQTGIFAEELRILFDVATWGRVLLSGWAHLIFFLLHLISTGVCGGKAPYCVRDGFGPPLPPQLREDLRGQTAWHASMENQALAAKIPATSCSFFSVMVDLSMLMTHLTDLTEDGHLLGVGQSLTESANNAQAQFAACVKVDGGTFRRFARMLYSHRSLWLVLAVLTNPGTDLSNFWRPEVQGISFAQSLHPGVEREALPTSLCGEPLCVNRWIPSPQGLRGLKVRVIGANVLRLRLPTGDVFQLDLSLFFEPVGSTGIILKACDSYLGGSWFKLECTFWQRGRSTGLPVAMSTSFAFAFYAHRPQNTYICSVPEGVDLTEPFQVFISAAEFRRPLELRFCPSVASEQDQVEVMVCTRPFFDARSLEKERGMIGDWLTYHRHIGVGRFLLYDNDGTLDSLPLNFAKDVTILNDAPRDRRCFSPISNTSGTVAPWTYLAAERTRCQELAYDHCLHYSRNKARWILMLRAPDKFLAGTARKRVMRQVTTHAIKNPLVGAVSLRQREFGGFEVPGVSERAPVVQRYLMRAPVNHHTSFVQLVDPRRTFFIRTHCSVQWPGFQQVATERTFNIWVNHYIDFNGRRRGHIMRGTAFNWSDPHLQWAVPLLRSRPQRGHA